MIKRDVHADNERVFSLLSAYLSHVPDLIDADMMRSMTDEAHLPPATAYALLLCSLCGLDAADRGEGQYFYENYFVPMVTELDARAYKHDAYMKTVRFPESREGGWVLGHLSYRPYEAFPWNDPQTLPDGRILPQIGFFPTAYRYPAVFQNDREWMSVVPNEVETMKAPIAAARGRVLTYGLGLGYFAFHAAEKAEVSAVTVVERDPDVIDLFLGHILPQFPHREKITVVRDDAFHYAETVAPGAHFDVSFTDLWHDPTDGIALYRRMKALEALCPDTQHHYWIEKTLRLYL